MAEDRLEQQIAQLRDVSLPRMYEIMDAMKGDIRKILDLFAGMDKRQSISEVRVEPLTGIVEKQTVLETKMKTISGILWGIGSILTAGIIGLGGWLFSLIVGKIPH